MQYQTFLANIKRDKFLINFNCSIFKQAITLPQNVTFTLSKTGNSSNTTEIRVGTRVSFMLQILFPLGTTDMLVELFAPDNESMVMMLCDVKVLSKGTNLGISAGRGSVLMDSQNGSSTLVQSSFYRQITHAQFVMLAFQF